MQLLDDVRPLTLNDYEEVLAAYARDCGEITGVHAIYQFGNVGAPGLSDIDLMVVVDEHATPKLDDLQRLSVRHEAWQREPRMGACFIHNVFVCSTSVFADIEWFSPQNQWRRLTGSDVPRQQQDVAERRTASLVHGLDFSIGRLHELVRLQTLKSCSLRWLIPQLWSLTHTMSILESAGVALEPTWKRVADALSELRSADGKDRRAAFAADLLPTVITHFQLSVDHFARLLTLRHRLEPPQLTRSCSMAAYSSRAMHAYHGAGVDGSPFATSATSLSRRLRIFGRTVVSEWSRVDLPAVILAHHLQYLVADPSHDRIPPRLARLGRMLLSSGTSETYQRVVRKRATLVKKNNQAMRDLRIDFTQLAIPGLLAMAPINSAKTGTWRYRALRSLLDWQALPVGVLGLEN
ncbi:MAG: hypothetical protein ACREND_04265 [Gemmatimonadaceae bacterium]